MTKKSGKTEGNHKDLKETVATLEDDNTMLDLLEASAQVWAAEAMGLAEHHGHTLATWIQWFDNFKDKKVDAIKTIRHKAKARVKRTTAAHSAVVEMIKLALKISNITHGCQPLYYLLTFLLSIFGFTFS